MARFRCTTWFLGNIFLFFEKIVITNYKNFLDFILLFLFDLPIFESILTCLTGYILKATIENTVDSVW